MVQDWKHFHGQEIKRPQESGTFLFLEPNDGKAAGFSLYSVEPEAEPGGVTVKRKQMTHASGPPS